jgi:hypothetical protein
MTLRSTQSLTEMSTRCISWGKGGRCVRLTTLPPYCVVVMKSRNLNFLEPSRPLQACNGTAAICPCLICVTSRNPKKATELTEEPPPVYRKSDIRLNTSICLYFMYITCTKSTDSLTLIAKPTVSPDTTTLSMANCAE